MAVVPEKPSALRALTEDELRSKLDALRDELYHLRYKMHVEEIENPNAKTLLRRNIARVLTELRARELAAQASAPVDASPETTPAS